MPNAIRAVRSKVRDYALALPEAHEDLPWGERVVKVHNKVFAFLGHDQESDAFSLSVKLPTSHKNALRLPFTEKTGYGLGKSNWVSATLNEKSQASFEMLRDWVRESYCAVAPKGLAERVSAERSLAKAAKTAKARAAKAAPAKKRAARR